jgi:F-type H+-transporting ATPase subunit alpha
VISITDGQIFLQSDLFNANQRPAIDVGISVSRVGGAAQVKAMKSIAGTLKIGLAQYRDMEAFAMFASDLDAASRRQLDRGARLVELLRQPQYSPYPVEDQVVSVWAGTTGKFDDIPVSEVLRFEQEFLAYLRHNTQVLATIAETGKFDDDTAKATTDALDAFRRQYVTTDGHPLATADDQTEAIDESELDHEQIVVNKKRG